MISNPQSDNTIKKSLKSKNKQLESNEKISSLIYSDNLDPEQQKNQLFNQQQVNEKSYILQIKETDQTYPNLVEEREKTAYDNQQGLIDQIQIQDSGERTDQELKSLKYIYIGACYIQFRNYDQALQYFQQSLEIFQQIKNQDLIADTIINIGYCYEELGDLNNGLENYKKSLELFFI
ncbi:hypothetical protein ABPG72_002727 [Tetrahymena utriculariae]